MPRRNIQEAAEADIVKNNTRLVFKPVHAETPAIPQSYDGKYALMMAIATDIEPSEAQMDQLEAAIEDITGVHKSFILIGPARLPLDRVPSGTDLSIWIDAGFAINPKPEPQQ